MVLLLNKEKIVIVVKPWRHPDPFYKTYCCSNCKKEVSMKNDEMYVVKIVGSPKRMYLCLGCLQELHKQINNVFAEIGEGRGLDESN